MDCTDKYCNMQPSTNDISVVCHLNERSLKTFCALLKWSSAAKPPFYLCDTILTNHFAFLDGILKGEANAKSTWSPVLLIGSWSYGKAQIIQVLAVTKET